MDGVVLKRDYYYSVWIVILCYLFFHLSLSVFTIFLLFSCSFWDS